jgi:hypothetical protein
MRSAIALLFLNPVWVSVSASTQQVEMFPPGPYVTHCRGLYDDAMNGGDDDHVNIYFIIVYPSVVDDGTAAPDFFIHLWDGDQNADSGTGPLTQDADIYNDSERAHVGAQSFRADQASRVKK